MDTALKPGSRVVAAMVNAPSLGEGLGNRSFLRFLELSSIGPAKMDTALKPGSRVVAAMANAPSLGEGLENPND
jgi:hypothetical protein